MTTGIAPESAQSAAAPATVPLDEIRTLVDERGRYEGWLDALDARRAVTPAHVLERVREDYAGRLSRVADQLGTHAAPLRAHEQSLAERHQMVEQQLVQQRDTLAEVELRTLVGEYSPEDGEQRRAGTEQAIATLERDLGGSAAALAEVRGLVARVTPAPGAASTTAGATVSTSAGHDVPSATEHGGGTPSSGSAEAASVPHDAGAPLQAGDPTTLRSVGSAGESDTVSHGASDHGAPGRGESGHGTPNHGTYDQGAIDPGAFDHGAVDAARVALGDRESSFTPAFSDAIRSGGAAYGFGAGRPPAPEPAAAGQEKTLRCQDCGAFNYPTEWYCEKCGGELAAL